MENTTITDFGKEIKKRLIDMGKNQKWLIERVSDETGLYFDRSYIHKIMTGQLNTPRVVQAIKEILENDKFNSSIFYYFYTFTIFIYIVNY